MTEDAQRRRLTVLCDNIDKLFAGDNSISTNAKKIITSIGTKPPYTTPNVEASVQLLQLIDRLVALRSAHAVEMESSPWFDGFAITIDNLGVFAYLMGRSYWESTSIELSISDLVVVERFYIAASRLGNPDAQFELAVFYAANTGPMRSPTAALNLFYQAGSNYLRQSNVPRALAAAEGINRLDSNHPLAKKLLCEAQAKFLFTTRPALPGVQIPDVPVNCDSLISGKARPRAPREPTLPAAAGEPQNGATIDEKLFQDAQPVASRFISAVNQRQTAESVYVQWGQVLLGFNPPRELNDDGVTAIKDQFPDSHNVNTIIVGYDFSNALSFSLSTLIPEDKSSRREIDSVNKDKFDRIGLTNDASDDHTILSAEMDYQFYTLYYYPVRSFYLGLGYLVTSFTVKFKDYPVGTPDRFRFTEKNTFAVAGFSFELYGPKIETRREQLDLVRNGWSIELGGFFAFPVKQVDNEFIKYMAGLVVGARFY